MKKTDVTVNIFVKLVILTLFILFSYYKMRINLFFIITELFIFIFLNSFILTDDKVRFDIELFSFQGMLIFLFVRPIIFYWDGIPDKIYEKIFYNYNYVIYFFIFYIISVFIFFRMKKNVFWEKYFYYFLIYMVLISNIFNIGYLIKIYNLFSFYFISFSLNEAWLTHWFADIILFGFLVIFFLKKNRNFIYTYPFLVLCFIIRNLTN